MTATITNLADYRTKKTLPKVCRECMRPETEDCICAHDETFTDEELKDLQDIFGEPA